MIKLNLGCGSVRPNGWINTDSSLNASIQKIPVIGKRISKLFNPVEYSNNNFKYMNLNRKWPYGINTVDVVYASHLFEHLTLNSANLFLAEAYRCLKPGGAIRIVVPDLYQIAKKYIDEFEGTNELKDTTAFIMWAINMHREGQYGNSGFFKKIALEYQGYPHQHKYMYDIKSLTLKFKEFGFVDIISLEYGISKYVNEITDVEGTKEAYLSVYLEALKPVE
ncbi:MAG TPA: methyltransferase domain-containing protein [Panacibacter sp.]|nr:methyltransferase domain-containing protein [Panacibacter sp.]